MPVREQTPQSQPAPVLLRVAVVLVLLFAFLLGVKELGDAFRLLGQDLLTAFFAATENPFVGLVVGLLATTLVQSSSVSTSMIVGRDDQCGRAPLMQHAHHCRLEAYALAMPGDQCQFSRGRCPSFCLYRRFGDPIGDRR